MIMFKKILTRIKKDWILLVFLIGGIWFVNMMLGGFGIKDPLTLVNYTFNSGLTLGVITYTEHASEHGDDGRKHQSVYFEYNYTVNGVKYKVNDVHTSPYDQTEVDVPYECRVHQV